MSTTQTIDRMMELHRFIRQQMHSLPKESSGRNLLQLHALSIVREHAGMTMKELASGLRITPPSATAFVARLVKHRCVERFADPKNRRVVRLRITPTGTRLLSAAMRGRRKILRDVVQLLSSRDQREFTRIISTLIGALRSRK